MLVVGMVIVVELVVVMVEVCDNGVQLTNENPDSTQPIKTQKRFQ